jgi:hypothetical protein
MKSIAAFMRAVSKQNAGPSLTALSDDKLKMLKVEEYYERFNADFPFNDGAPKQRAVQKPKQQETAIEHPTEHPAKEDKL